MIEGEQTKNRSYESNQALNSEQGGGGGRSVTHTHTAATQQQRRWMRMLLMETSEGGIKDVRRERLSFYSVT